MGALKWLTIISSVQTLLVAFYLYSPVPAGLENPWLTRTYIAGLRAANFVDNASFTQAFAAEMLTGMSRANVLRWQIEALYVPVFHRDADITVQNLKFDGIPVRLYRPVAASSSAPSIVFFHGGGWSLFSVDSYDLVTQSLAKQVNAVVISVDYRLAPEKPYPVPFDDCVKATRYVLHHAETFGIDSSRVAVAGDGSGGSLAAAVALRLSEEDPGYTPPLKLQILLQPALQAFSFDTPSYRQNAQYTLVDRSQMIEFWCHYLGVDPTQSTISSFVQNQHLSPSLRRQSIFSTYILESNLPTLIKNNYVGSVLDKYSDDYDQELSGKVEHKVTDTFVSPLMAEDVSRLPTAYVVVAEYDVLRDDGLFYASRLEAANVSVKINYITTATQGLLTPVLGTDFFTSELSVKTWQGIYAFIQQEL